MRRDLVAALALLLLAAAAPARAVPTGLQPCADDLQRLCPGLTGAALKQCRIAHEANLSPACRQALAEHGLKLKDVKP